MSRLRNQAVLVGFVFSLTACAGAGGQSLEDLRSEFVAAGGTCSVSVSETTTTTESTTTTETVSEEESGQYQSLEYLNCGESEAAILRYKSEQDARISWWVSQSLIDGLVLSLFDDLNESQSIVKDNFRIYLPIDEYSESRAEEIAREIGGTVHSNSDSALRSEILALVGSGSANGGLKIVASTCAMRDNLSSDEQSIEVDTKGEDESDGDGVASAFCLLRATVAPDFIFDSIKQTRALDGRLEETYGEYRVSWNYHPDSGLNLSLIFVG